MVASRRLEKISRVGNEIEIGAAPSFWFGVRRILVSLRNGLGVSFIGWCRDPNRERNEGFTDVRLNVGK